MKSWARKLPETIGAAALMLYVLFTEVQLVGGTVVVLGRTALHSRPELLVESAVVCLVCAAVTYGFSQVPFMRYTFFGALALWRKENWDLLSDVTLEQIGETRMREYLHKRYLWGAFMVMALTVHMNHLSGHSWWAAVIVVLFLLFLMFVGQVPLYGLAYAALVAGWLAYVRHRVGVELADVEALVIAIMTTAWLLHGAFIKYAERSGGPTA